MRITCLHIIKCRIQSWVQRQIELVRGVLCKRHAGSGRLRVVDQHVNAAKGIDCLLYHVVYHCLVVRPGIDICLNRQHLDVVEPLKLLLGIFKLPDIASGDDQICPFLGISRGNAVSNRAASAVTQDCPARPRDNCCLSC